MPESRNETTVLQPGRFLGNRLRQVNASGLLLDETQYTPGTVLPTHAHVLPNICLVVDGAFNDTVGSVRRECVPGSVLLRTEEEVHGQSFSYVSRVFSLELSLSRLTQAREYTSTFDFSQQRNDPQIAMTLHRIRRELHRADSLVALAVEGLWLELVAQLARVEYSTAREKNDYGNWVGSARDFIEANFGRSFSLAELASAVGIEPLRLTRVFRKAFGLPVSDYTRQLRVSRAMTLLSDTNRSITSVALSVGFFDHSHFTHAFKALVGITPSAYRRAIQKG